MKQPTIKSFHNLFCITAFLLLFTPFSTFACTIASAVAADGQVWNANNEDGPFGVASFINVFPKTERTRYGYYTLSYFSPALGEGGSMQGGTNEAGLTFDFNAIKRVENFDPKNKKAFPQGDAAILPHILANMSTVQEVIDFFDTYWFQNGFWSAQMHVADKQGRFAIISASGVKLVKKGQPLVSTNFDICGGEDGSSCWRYPIATSKLCAANIDLTTMMSICLETAQKNGSTMYSNIQNLTTGDVWFFSQYDPDIVVKTNLAELLLRGRRSYTFSDLGSILVERPSYSWKKPVRINLTSDTKAKHTGSYHNSFTGQIEVRDHRDGIEVSFADGRSEVFHPQSEDKFFIPDADVYVEFSFDSAARRQAMSLHENGYWAFTAWENAVRNEN